MMPDLGKYAEAVLSAYAVSLVLLAVLIIGTLVQGRRARAEMKKIEAGAGRKDG